MAFSFTIKRLPLALVLLCISTLGNAYDEDVPQGGGTGFAGYDPFTGTNVVGDEPHTGTGVPGDVPVPETGAGFIGDELYTGTGVAGDVPVPETGAGFVGDHPAQIVAKALLCFNEKHIYSSCEESYRLTQAGDLHVPPDYADEYCNGPCLTETHLVLNCLENIMANFVFYNKATIQDVRETIKAGCGYGPERGDFDVAEHLQAEENSAYKTVTHILLGLAFVILGNALFL